MKKLSSIIIFTFFSLSLLYLNLLFDNKAYGGDIIYVPVSWCALHRSPATDPNIEIPNREIAPATDDSSLEDKLTKRLDRVNEWIISGNNAPNKAEIILHPNFDSHGLHNQYIRILDQVISSGSAPGDLLNYNINSDEQARYLDHCEQGWIKDGSARGLIALNVRLFVDGTGGWKDLIGVAGCTEVRGTNQCAKPYNGYITVTDNFFLYPGLPNGGVIFSGNDGDRFDWNVGHELGHALGLDHVGGTQNLMYESTQDNDGNGIIDNFDLSHANERDMRASAKNVMGERRDPPQQIIPGSFVGAAVFDNLTETRSGYTDLGRLSVDLDTSNDTLYIGQKLGGLVPEKKINSTQYWSFLNTDDNNTTGITTDLFQKFNIPEPTIDGIDFILKADLSNSNLTGTGWYSNNTSGLYNIKPGEINFTIQTLILKSSTLNGSTTDSFPIYDIINAELNNSLPFSNDKIVHLNKNIPVDGLISQNEIILDRMNTNHSLFLTKPSPYPTCLSLNEPEIGKEAKIQAYGFIPNSTIYGTLGNTTGILFKENTDQNGNATISFFISDENKAGLNILNIYTVKEPITSKCVVNIINKN